jgi:hypothetical protein
MNIRMFLYICVFLFIIIGINVGAESLESDSASPGQVSGSVGSDTVPTKKLEELTKPPDAISETVEEANESAEEKINNPDLQEKPLGVREAEGKVIGE